MRDVEKTTVSFRPLGDRVIVEPIDPEKMTPGGIILAETVNDKPTRGIVVAVGKGLKNPDGSRVPVDIEVNDEVLFNAYVGSEIEVCGVSVKILKEEDVIAVLERE